MGKFFEMANKAPAETADRIDVFVQPYGQKFKLRFHFSQKVITKIMTKEEATKIGNDPSYKLMRV